MNLIHIPHFGDIDLSTEQVVVEQEVTVENAKQIWEMVTAINESQLDNEYFVFLFSKTIDEYGFSEERALMDSLIKFLLHNGFKVKFPNKATQTITPVSEKTPSVTSEALGLTLSDPEESSEVKYTLTYATTSRARGFEIVADKHRKNPDKEIILPTRGSKHSAGYDLYSPVDLTIKPGETGRIITDVKAYMLPDEMLTVHTRSGNGLKGIVLRNTTGIVDSDYYNNKKNDGNIHVVLYNDGESDFYIEAGDRVAQGIFEKYLLADGDDFESGAERTGGHGHTGR